MDIEIRESNWYHPRTIIRGSITVDGKTYYTQYCINSPKTKSVVKIGISHLLDWEEDMLKMIEEIVNDNRD